MSTFWQEVLARPREIYAKLSRGQRMGVLALASVGIVVAVLSSLLAGRESFALLYNGLEPQDARAVCGKLQEMGVPYRLSPDEASVQVPEQRVAEARMQLSGAGLPKLGSRGFELFDESQLGLTDALFNVNLERAIAGDIEQSIAWLGPVKKARVRVNLGTGSSFRRDQSRPTAAVTLWLRPGMPLSDSEVASIAFLVAGSVGHGIKLQDVTIVDNDARTLHPRGDEDDSMFSIAYLQKVQSIEREKQEKAESQLRAAFGENKAAVRVSVELDLSHKETASEEVADDNKVPVKETISTDTTGSGSSGADPSLSAGKAGKEPKEAGSSVTRRDTETEYHEGTKKLLTIDPAGSIRRMSVSVLLDESDDSLKTRKVEIEQIVKSAVGFMEKRTGGGKDEITVALAPFAKPAPPEAAPGPFAIENLLPLLGHVAEGITVLFVLVLLARTLRGGAVTKRKVRGAGAGSITGGASDDGPEQEPDELVDLEFADGKGPDLRMKLGRFVNKHPEQAREVLVAWLKEEVAS